VPQRWVRSCRKGLPTAMAGSPQRWGTGELGQTASGEAPPWPSPSSPAATLPAPPSASPPGVTTRGDRPAGVRVGWRVAGVGHAISHGLFNRCQGVAEAGQEGQVTASDCA
jgi:hypothetical protein